MTTSSYRSWAGERAHPNEVLQPTLNSHKQIFGPSYLAYGAGRSYGDTCLPPDSLLIDTSNLRGIIAFDQDSGILRAYAGTQLHEILDVIVPRGWFIPVTPGTSSITIGGAIANDVHGKNHHVAGTFGLYVSSFELSRSDGSIYFCSRDTNANLFSATIGGMGLTGLIIWAEIILTKISSSKIIQTITRFDNLDSYFKLDRSQQSAPYSVAWIDGMATSSSIGRGILIEGYHSDCGDLSSYRPRPFSMPFLLPWNLVVRPAVRLMNALYIRKPDGRSIVDYNSFFYPLDRIANWSHLYGKSGFHQFQCVVPEEHARDAFYCMLRYCLDFLGGSTLVVIKRFGSIRSPGLLSFPIPGYTITLDFPAKGESSRMLVTKLEKLTLDAGGRVNPYKSRMMSLATFESSFPHWKRILPWLDPCAESRFSRRLGIGCTYHSKNNDSAINQVSSQDRSRP